MLKFQKKLKKNHMGIKLGFHKWFELSWKHIVIQACLMPFVSPLPTFLRPNDSFLQK